MSKWKETQLKVLADIRVSNVDKKIHPSKSLVKLCNYMDAYSNDYISSKITFSIGSADENEINRFGLKKGDVIITKDSETPEDIAVSSVVVEELENTVCGYHLAILRPDTSEIDGTFLMFRLKEDSLKRYFLSVANGSTRFGLTIGNIERAVIKYPPLLEQIKIAHVLSTCDAVIEKTQAAIDKYKAIKQGMLHDLFARGIDIKTGKLRPHFEEAREFYKESKLGWIPKEWIDDELAKYLSFISYGFTNPMPDTNEGPYLITAANVNGGRIQYETCRKTSQDAFDNLLTDKSRPKINDILLTKDGTLGRIAIVEEENLCINQSVAVLRPNKLIDPLFLKILLESPSYQKTMLDEAGGSTIKHIYITIVDKMLIAVPKEIEEQKEIAIRLKSIENKLQSEQNYLYKLHHIKAGLMGDLLSGKKLIQVNEVKEEFAL